MRHLQHERAAIDLASFRGISSNAIVKRYGLGSHGAYKHKANHLPTLRANEGVESAQVAEEHRHLPAMACQTRGRRIRGSNNLRHLRRQKSPQTVDALDCRDLLRDPLLERAVPTQELLGLLLQLRRLQLRSLRAGRTGQGSSIRS